MKLSGVFQLCLVAVCFMAWVTNFSPPVRAAGITSEGAMVCSVLEPYATRVEEAIEKAHRFLADHQRDDGSFPGRYGDSAGVVSLVGLSFMAVGHTPGQGPYGSIINRCLDYVLAQQNDDGYIFADGRPDRGMYTHLMSTLFLSEVSGMVDPEREPRVRDALGRALRVILSAQDVGKSAALDGGWRYSPGTDESDLTVSGWGVLALRSARINGAPIPDTNIRRAVDFVRRLQDADGTFGYRSPGSDRRVSLTSVGALCLLLTGHHDSEEVEKARRWIMGHYRRLPRENFALYGSYYVMQAAFQIGGETWRDIGAWFYERYLPEQQEDGSWGAGSGGRHIAERQTPAYNTALVVNALAVPYRQLPAYQRDEMVDE